MTSYVVLSRQEKSPENTVAYWRQEVTIEAVSAEAAVRKAVDGDKGGTYVAVPLRSFQEMTVTVETKRTLKLA